MSVLSQATIFSMDLEEKIRIRDDHTVFNSFVDAYRHDRPVTISPDIIWLLIVQGFSNHVNFHAEKLRSKFVNFYGQKELHVFRQGQNFTKDDCISIIPEFVDQISKYTGKEIIDTLTPNFTTTTPVSVTSAQLSIMCAMKHYFKYVCHKCICHFPFIVVEGQKSDWEEILEKLNIIEKYDLKFWVKSLRPIIRKIIDSFNGNINKKFWKNMLHIVDSRGAYHPGYTNGWLTEFFLYDKYGQRVNGYISTKTELTSEILKIPFVVDFSGKTVNYEFLTGFFGVTQDTKTSSIKPVIGWAVRRLDDEEKPEKIGFDKPKQGGSYVDDDDDDDEEDDDQDEDDNNDDDQDEDDNNDDDQDDEVDEDEEED